MARDNVLLVDADVLRYQIAFANEDSVDWDDDDDVSKFVTPEKATLQTESFIEEMMDTLKGTKMVIVLSGKRNFRVELDETYKANRKDKEKPVLWQHVSDYLEWGDHGHVVIEMPRLEGDDVLGILHTGEYLDRSIMVTIDKDMFTVPGKVYRWNRSEEGTVPVSPREAAFFHLTQVLTGDQVDNYKGCPGIGEKKAAAILEQCRDPQDYWEAIIETYCACKRADLTEADAIHQARLAFILRDGWYNPTNHKVKLWTPAQLRGL